MFNSTPGLDGLITWAADRFTAAGLTPPTVTEVSFYGEHLDVCTEASTALPPAPP